MLMNNMQTFYFYICHSEERSDEESHITEQILESEILRSLRSLRMTRKKLWMK